MTNLMHRPFKTALRDDRYHVPNSQLLDKRLNRETVSEASGHPGCHCRATP